MLTVLQSQVTNAAQSEGITDTITVPLKYHDALTSQGAIFRTLRVFGVDAEPSAQPTKSSLPSRPSSTALAARVDDAESTAAATEEQWEIVENYKDAEEGDSTWTLKGRDQVGIDKAKSAVQEAIDKAKAATHVGFLTLPDRSSFPRIVGAKGSNIARLHTMTGASIHVGRENSTITITGSFSGTLAASSSLRDGKYRSHILARRSEGGHFENRSQHWSSEAGPLRIEHDSKVSGISGADVVEDHLGHSIVRSMLFDVEENNTP